MSPDVFRWARETAGLTVEAAAAGLHCTADRLGQIEAGSEVPSRPLLLRMSKQYRRPLLTFYLPRPPETGERGGDFRTLPGENMGNSEPLLQALLRDVVARQGLVRSLLEGENTEPLTFIASARMADGVASLLAAIEGELTISRQQFRAKRGPESAFDYLREQAERKGVFVLLAGNLGSHHSSISVDVFRGYARADSIAPFVVVNDQDAKAAWSFTLLHELAHLWLGESGVSGGFVESRLEVFCNEVASTFLLDPVELEQLEVDSQTPSDVALRRISVFSRARNLSGQMVAYGLYKAGRLDLQNWRRVATALRGEAQLAAEQRREAARARAETGGPSYYVVKRHRLGDGLLRLVRRTMSEGDLTPTKAAKILGVKARSVEPLLGAL